MDALLNSKIGKILFAIPLFVFGLFHFMNGPAMAGMVPSFLPAPTIFVYLVGAALIAAAVSIFIGKKTRLAMALLTILLLIFVLTVHLPGVMGGDEAQMMMSMSGLLKDLGLAGGAMVIGAHSEN